MAGQCPLSCTAHRLWKRVPSPRGHCPHGSLAWRTPHACASSRGPVSVPQAQCACATSQGPASAPCLLAGLGVAGCSVPPSPVICPQKNACIQAVFRLVVCSGSGSGDVSEGREGEGRGVGGAADNWPPQGHTGRPKSSVGVTAPASGDVGLSQ